MGTKSNKIMMILAGVVMVTSVLIFASQGMSTTIVSDDFESYSTGTIDPESSLNPSVWNWFDSSGDHHGAAIVEDSGNKLLAIGYAPWGQWSHAGYISVSSVNLSDGKIEASAYLESPSSNSQGGNTYLALTHSDSGFDETNDIYFYIDRWEKPWKFYAPGIGGEKNIGSGTSVEVKIALTATEYWVYVKENGVWTEKISGTHTADGTGLHLGLIRNKTQVNAEGQSKFDDALLTQVPEPATIGLFAAGALGFLRRK